MNKHTKIVVSILAIVLLLLILATVSFSMDISRQSAAVQTEVSDGTVNADGNEIVQSDEGLYGVDDAAGNTRIAPVWEQLHFIGSEYLSAGKDTAEGLRLGVLDLDGNVIAPFVYSEVYALTPDFYLAVFADSGQIVVYDAGFRAIDAAVWDDFIWENQQLSLIKGEDTFSFSLEDAQMVLEKADISRSARSFSFSLEWSRGSLTECSPTTWSDVADTLLQFVQMVRTQSFSNLDQVVSVESLENLESSLTLKRIRGVGDTLYITTGTDSDGNPVLNCHISLSVHVDADNVQQKTLSVELTQEAPETWVITAAQIG